MNIISSKYKQLVKKGRGRRQLGKLSLPLLELNECGCSRKDRLRRTSGKRNWQRIISRR